MKYVSTSNLTTQLLDNYFPRVAVSESKTILIHINFSDVNGVKFGKKSPNFCRNGTIQTYLHLHCNDSV